MLSYNMTGVSKSRHIIKVAATVKIQETRLLTVIEREIGRVPLVIDQVVFLICLLLKFRKTWSPELFDWYFIGQTRVLLTFQQLKVTNLTLVKRFQHFLLWDVYVQTKQQVGCDFMMPLTISLIIINPTKSLQSQ